MSQWGRRAEQSAGLFMSRLIRLIRLTCLGLAASFSTDRGTGGSGPTELNIVIITAGW